MLLLYLSLMLLLSIDVNDAERGRLSSVVYHLLVGVFKGSVQ